MKGRAGHTKRREDEIKLPPHAIQRDRRHLTPDRANDPVPYARREGVSLAANLHRHDLRHVHPADGPERGGEDTGDAEEEEDAADAVAGAGAVEVLRVEGGFADEGDGDGGGAEEERLLAADPVEEEGDEDQVGEGADDVVDSGDQRRAVAGDAEVFVPLGWGQLG